MSGNKRLASINTPAVMVIHTAANTGADDKKPFNGVLLLNSFENSPKYLKTLWRGFKAIARNKN